MISNLRHEDGLWLPLKRPSHCSTHPLGAPLVRTQGSGWPGSDCSGSLCSSSGPSSSENVGLANARSQLDRPQQLCGSSGHWPSAPLWQDKFMCHYNPFTIQWRFMYKNSSETMHMKEKQFFFLFHWTVYISECDKVIWHISLSFCSLKWFTFLKCFK